MQHGHPGARRRPAGRAVQGATMPISTRTVATQMVLLPDMGGYSTCSIITNPAAAAGSVAGSNWLQLAAG
jgi:hypothetical protein